MENFKIGDHVRKTRGSQWQGVIVGTYSTALTPVGYAVESSTERGSVQIYPAAALEIVEPAHSDVSVPRDVANALLDEGRRDATWAAQDKLRALLNGGRS